MHAKGLKPEGRSPGNKYSLPEPVLQGQAINLQLFVQAKEKTWSNFPPPTQKALGSGNPKLCSCILMFRRHLLTTEGKKKKKKKATRSREKDHGRDPAGD